MSRYDNSERTGDFGVADMFLAGRTDVLSDELETLFRAAAGPATPAELSGGADAIAAFLAFGPASAMAVAEAGADRAPARTPVRRRLAAALTGAALLLGGMSAAAYAGGLPGPLQTVANRVLPGVPAPVSADGVAGGDAPTSATVPTTDGASDPSTDPSQETTTGPTTDASDTPAPSDHPTTDDSDTPAPSDHPTTDDSDTPAPSTSYVPKPLGAAAYGTCTAYEAGGVSTGSTTYLDLAAAAGGAEKIDSFCADVIAAKKAKVTKPPKTKDDASAATSATTTTAITTTEPGTDESTSSAPGNSGSKRPNGKACKKTSTC